MVLYQLRWMDGSLVEPTISQVKSTKHFQLARILVRLLNCWTLETRTVFKIIFFYFILAE